MKPGKRLSFLALTAQFGIMMILHHLLVGCTLSSDDGEDHAHSDSDSDSDSDGDGDGDADTGTSPDTGTFPARDTAFDTQFPPVNTDPVDTGDPPVTTAPILSGEILGRPTDTSVTVHLVTSVALEIYFEHGVDPGIYTGQTAAVHFPAGPVEVVMDGLTPSTLYFYRMRYRGENVIAAPTDTALDGWILGKERFFRTQRAAGSTFTFTIQSDSHMGYPSFYDARMYNVTLKNVYTDAPDFHIDLGDLVSTDDNRETAATVNEKYLAQRDFLGTLAHSIPLFLVLGNHENEEGWNLDDNGTNVAGSLPVLGANARKRYFVNPVPDRFYTGNETVPLTDIEGDGLLEDYYAWEWGDALFVVLDPYWYTPKKPYEGTIGGEKEDEVIGNRWDWSLGTAQYQWLERTLAGCDATFKFVFIHQLTGGADDYGRGGAAFADLCEWGGHDPGSDEWTFDVSRPALSRPVHQLLVMHGVNVLFHGHDHAFAKEQRDGVTYQMAPMAAYLYTPGGGTDQRFGFDTNAVDYPDADMVENSGHIRATVTAASATIEYVRAFLDGQGENRSVAASYNLAANNNFAPVADSLSVMAEEGLPREIPLVAHDFNDDPLTFAVADPPVNGTLATDLAATPPRVTYSAADGFAGEDRFTFVADDGAFLSNRATVRITVVPEGTLVATDTGIDTEVPTDTDNGGDTDTATTGERICPDSNHNVACVDAARCESFHGLADSTYACADAALVCCALPPSDPCPVSEELGILCLSPVVCATEGGIGDATVTCADRSLTCCVVP